MLVLEEVRSEGCKCSAIVPLEGNQEANKPSQHKKNEEDYIEEGDFALSPMRR